MFPAVITSFFRTLKGDYLHRVEELWLSLPVEANFEMDVSKFRQQKAGCPAEHVSRLIEAGFKGIGGRRVGEVCY